MTGTVVDLEPSRRAPELATSAAAAYLRRMGEPSWAAYVWTAVVSGLLARRRGVTGLALRRLAYRFWLGAAEAPVVCEDVVIRGPRRVRLGRGAQVEQGVVLDAKTDHAVGIELGASTLVRAGALLDTGYGGWIRVGDRSQIGHACELRGLGGLEIGERCMIAHGCALISGEHVADDPSVPMMDQGNRLATVRIGDDVWLGANVVVLHGVTIGRGAIVGANAVVRDDVPPGAIAVGSPARVVRRRAGFDVGGAP